ncbi:tRNA-uridine aminocarboxypropyltransferase 2 isoform X4 [Myiozetetes cayanensis]|uniref:tRNA-uridine aminocarboxypropyltransferase 2 isoform X4 n=1 Tax=Myiozetetes cayanensis TaxID=478635 RepID=UPI00215E67C0|nr:tRNA-uridine aminocarboxypropyltransferase 2 isoform X4 [Myiozetetes cayanensis]
MEGMPQCDREYLEARQGVLHLFSVCTQLKSKSRPQKVCLCPFLPVHPLKVSTCLYIIQHPAEESRVLRTVPLLAACLPPDKCKILVGRRFSEDRYPELATVCRNPSTLILYPGAEATNLEEVAVMSPRPSVMIIIDGTWSQAKDIFYKNSLFRLPKQVNSLCPLRAAGSSGAGPGNGSFASETMLGCVSVPGKTEQQWHGHTMQRRFL